MDNQTIAKKLFDHAHFLERMDANLYRIRAYRRAAETVLALHRGITEIVAAEGRSGLEALPGIGRHISYTLHGLVTSGAFHTLNRDHRLHEIASRASSGQPALPFEAALSDATPSG